MQIVYAEAILVKLCVLGFLFLFISINSSAEVIDINIESKNHPIYCSQDKQVNVQVQSIGFTYDEASDRKPSSCCRVCTVGKPCGNSCINVSYACTRPPGCACSH